MEDGRRRTEDARVGDLVKAAKRKRERGDARGESKVLRSKVGGSIAGAIWGLGGYIGYWDIWIIRGKIARSAGRADRAPSAVTTLEGGIVEDLADALALFTIHACYVGIVAAIRREDGTREPRVPTAP
jgi:hypothetical protein